MQPNATSTPTIALSGNSVRVDGVTPGGQTILFSASLRSSDGVIVQSCIARSLWDDDRDGSSLYSGRTIPLRSVWLAVDVETGRYTVATPTGFDLTPLPISSTAFRRDLDGIAGVYDLQELAAEVLVVRPGAGAWRLRAFEGGSGDADHLRNGRMSLPVESTTPVPGTTASPPRHLRKGDIIAIIEPNRLELFVVEIDR